MMTSVENLHYAIGELAYAMACVDGDIQKSERQKFQDIVFKELNKQHYSFDVSSIVFQVMEKGHSNFNDAYNSAMKQIRLNSHYLSPELKKSFILVLEEIAAAYPPVTASEKNMLNKFKTEFEPIHGDPVFYERAA